MAIKKRPLSPRQRMINLLYLVLMAMLALNVSNEVLDGFTIVEESLNRTTKNASKENTQAWNSFEEQYKHNPEKVKAWFAQAQTVRQMSDSLFNFAQDLKWKIARQADGNNADVNNIRAKEDLNAASQVMLAPGSGHGKQLFEAINAFRQRMMQYVADDEQRKIIADNLSTRVPSNTRSIGKNWQQYMFENVPVAAAITFLTKLQSDVRQAEGTVLNTLMANIDMKDIRVNRLNAYVIPQKTTLYPGETFQAQIVMAAVDTTQQPEIYINGRQVAARNGSYSFAAGGIGEHMFSGYMTLRNRKGEVLKRNFSQRYEVVAPPSGATLAADMMNVLYAGYANPMSVSVSGIPQNAIRVSMTGGTLRSNGNGHYVAIPSTVGKDALFTVTATDNGKLRNLGTFAFRVRKLPDPTLYLAVGGTDRFKGGALAKGSLMGVSGVRAAIDDGLLDVEFKVTAFETVFYDNMGNAIPMNAAGANFTEAQRETFRKLSKNRRFYITRATVVGPDGIARRLPAAMEVIVK